LPERAHRRSLRFGEVRQDVRIEEVSLIETTRFPVSEVAGACKLIERFYRSSQAASIEDEDGPFVGHACQVREGEWVPGEHEFGIEHSPLELIEGTACSELHCRKYVGEALGDERWRDERRPLVGRDGVPKNGEQVLQDIPQACLHKLDVEIRFREYEQPPGRAVARVTRQVGVSDGCVAQDDRIEEGQSGDPIVSIGARRGIQVNHLFDVGHAEDLGVTATQTHGQARQPTLPCRSADRQHSRIDLGPGDICAQSEQRITGDDAAPEITKVMPQRIYRIWRQRVVDGQQVYREEADETWLVGVDSGQDVGECLVRSHRSGKSGPVHGVQLSRNQDAGVAAELLGAQEQKCVRQFSMAAAGDNQRAHSLRWLRTHGSRSLEDIGCESIVAMEFDARSFFPPDVLPEGFHVARGANDLLFTEDGKEYIDLMSGSGTVFLGHANPAIARRIGEQLTTVWNVGAIPTRIANDARRAVERFFPESQRLAALYSTGMEAVEFAIRVARTVAGRKGLVGFTGSMHGKSMAAAKLGWPNELATLPDFQSLAYLPERSEDEVLEDVRNAFVANPIAAVFLEPLLGSRGGHIPSRRFAEQLARLCTQHGVLLVMDEIFTGFHRTGTPFMYEELGITPDIVLVGKAMGNGFPVSGVVVDRRHRIDQRMLPGSTFAGNPLAAAAVLATLSEMESHDIPEKVATIQETILTSLKDLDDSVAMRGKGALWVLEFPTSAQARDVTARIFRAQVLVSPTANFIRLLPAATISVDHLRAACDAICAACMTRPTA
jgi:acetylornithine/succinyldiaminopimelate/putrescine aminotransferase